MLNRYHLTTTKSSLDFCNACHMAKAHKLLFVSHTSIVSQPLELVFSDVWGPSPHISMDGFRYYILFLDAYSKYTWIFPLKNKSDSLQIFIQFRTNVEMLFQLPIISLHTDHGGEFLAFKNYLQHNGISHRFSCPHTHEQNGSVERKHCHVVDLGLALLTYANLPPIFWVEAFLTSTYLINRMPTLSPQHKSPYETLFHTSPSFDHLRVFGSTCFPNLRPYNQHKFSPRSSPCVFLGYAPNHKGYICMDPHTYRKYISRDVLFNEKNFTCALQLDHIYSINSDISGPTNGTLHLSVLLPCPTRDTTPDASSGASSAGPASLLCHDASAAPDRSPPTLDQSSTHADASAPPTRMTTRASRGIFKPNP